MNTQAKIIASLLSLGAIPFAAAADFDDYARVVRVSPQVEQVNRPQQECRTEYVPVERQHSNRGGNRTNGGAIVGGIAGGLLGNQVGGGTGRVAATAAGAIIGALTGDRIENDGANRGQEVITTTTEERAVRSCRTVDHWESRNNGYAVTYDYRGHTYTSVMPYDPGERLKVRVSVSPLQ
jgi:uncharacterized protein YcfJ